MVLPWGGETPAEEDLHCATPGQWLSKSSARTLNASRFYHLHGTMSQVILLCGSWSPVQDLGEGSAHILPWGAAAPQEDSEPEAVDSGSASAARVMQSKSTSSIQHLRSYSAEITRVFCVRSSTRAGGADLRGCVGST